VWQGSWLVYSGACSHVGCRVGDTWVGERVVNRPLHCAKRLGCQGRDGRGLVARGETEEESKRRKRQTDARQRPRE
jgi:hypothetical protein